MDPIPDQNERLLIAKLSRSGLEKAQIADVICRGADGVSVEPPKIDEVGNNRVLGCRKGFYQKQFGFGIDRANLVCEPFNHA